MKSILFPQLVQPRIEEIWGDSRFTYLIMNPVGLGYLKNAEEGEGKSYVSGLQETKDAREHPKLNLGTHPYQHAKLSSWLYILSPYLSTDWLPCPECAALLCTESNSVNFLILMSGLILFPKSFPVKSSPQ